MPLLTGEAGDAGGHRPRVLYVVRHVPYVPGNGGVTRTDHLFKAATRAARVSLLAAQEHPPSARLDMMMPLCEDIVMVPRPEYIPPAPPGRVGRAARDIGSLLRSDPYPAHQF